MESARRVKRRRLPTEERQRAVRACAECRRLKEKCEGGVPCRRCRHLRRPCDINARPTIEKLSSDIVESPKDLMERLRCMTFILKCHLPDLALDTGSLRSTCDQLSASTSVRKPKETTSRVPGSTGIAEQSAFTQAPESPGIDGEDCTIDSVDDTTVHYSGEFSHWNFSMHIKRNMDQLMAKFNIPDRNDPTRIPDFFRIGESDPSSASISELIATFPPRPVANFLVRVFFKHATSFYYFVDRIWLHDTLEHIYGDTTSLSSKDVTASCLVLMLLAIGTQYSYLESNYTNGNGGAGIAADATSSSSRELDVGAAFYRQVAKLLSEVIHTGSVLSMQVFLLLGLYCLPLDASGLGYIYLNLAIKLAIQNGMHRDVSSSAFNAHTKELRRRIWWSAYCMERKIGIYHGRPASIVQSDIDVPLPSSVNLNTQSGDFFDPVGLLGSIDLTRQAEVFLYEISRLRKCARSEAGVIMAKIKLMKTNLRGSWLPPGKGASSVPIPDQGDRSTTRAELHSQLECCLLHMFIGRPFVLAHRHSQMRDASLQSDGVTEAALSQSNAQWDFLVQDCVAAAERAIDICHELQTGRLGLAKASYTEYSSCRASLLVLIAHSICYRTNDFSRTLQRGLVAIREMASVGDSARSEVSLIEMLKSALHRLRELDSMAGQPAISTMSYSTEEGYAGFVDWYTKAGASVGPDDGPAPSTDRNYQASGVQIHALDPQLDRNTPGLSMSFTAENALADVYPFDFDLLQMDADPALFASDISGIGEPERGIFESLFWMPR